MTSVAWRWINLKEKSESKEESNLVSKMLLEIYEKHINKNRHYHNLEHLEHFFREYDEISFELEYPHEFELAIFYHDYIYDPKDFENNEENSAIVAQINALHRMYLPKEFAFRVGKHIRNTKNHSGADSLDEAYFLDCDLAILGQDEETFEKYEENIRKEFSFVPECLYNVARSNILKSFLVGGIYMTDYFTGKYEIQATSNILDSLERLSSM